MCPDPGDHFPGFLHFPQKSTPQRLAPSGVVDDPLGRIDMPQRTRLTQRPLHAVTGFGHVTEQISTGDALRAIGEVVYAVRSGDLIKIGHTRNLARRRHQVHADEILGFVPGTRDDEQAVHARLAGHVHHGREWYYPTPTVMAVVNEMRERIGLEPVA